MAFIPVIFSPHGSSRRKIIHVIPSGIPTGLPQGSLCSLKTEHVFPAEWMRVESLRPTAAGAAARNAIESGEAAPDPVLFSLMRRWFWSRKAGSGFCIHGFPETRLQARVFDEWMEARDEILDICVVSEENDNHEVAIHYRILGVPVVSPQNLHP